jgi:hypothetical protein
MTNQDAKASIAWWKARNAMEVARTAWQEDSQQYKHLLAASTSSRDLSLINQAYQRNLTLWVAYQVAWNQAAG